MRKYTKKQVDAYAKAAKGDSSVMDSMFDGKSVLEKIEHIRDQGVLLSARSLRNSIIGGLRIRTKKPGQGAENVIVIGCLVFGTVIPLVSYCRLLQQLGVDYTFLTKELCCGVPLISRRLVEGAAENEMEQTFSTCREFIGTNIDMARQLGAKNMIYMCVWCYYLARRFYPDCDVAQLFYPDILVSMLQDRALATKPKTVAYFPGGQHHKAHFTGDVDWDADWRGYRKLLDKIEGLSVADVPTKYCCKGARDAIYQRAESSGTLVTVCLDCYGGLQRRSPPGIEVIGLPDILIEALGTGAYARRDVVSPSEIASGAEMGADKHSVH